MAEHFIVFVLDELNRAWFNDTGDFVIANGVTYGSNAEFTCSAPYLREKIFF